MACFSCPASCQIRCSTGRDWNDRNRPKLGNFKISGAASRGPRATKPDVLPGKSSGVSATFTSVAAVSENGYISGEQERQKNTPTKKQLVDSHRQGVIIEGGVGYRQTVFIRSYEVGADKTVTIESILNLFQETALNHVWMSGLLSNVFGATHGMMRNNLIWVVFRMHVQVDQYPIWGEVVEIDTWVGASGKNGMRRDWLIRSQANGIVFARATRPVGNRLDFLGFPGRLSKMPEEVRAELSPRLIEKQAVKEDNPEKIVKLNSKATYVNSDLKAKRADLDMNHHANNVKYVGWMLETIPSHFLEKHQLSSIILEYRRECGSSDIVQSLCEPEDDRMTLKEGTECNSHINLLNRCSLASEILEGSELLGSFSKGLFRFTHLLQINCCDSEKEETVRGKTTWNRC